MAAGSLKRAIRNRQPLLGLFCSTPSPIAVELIAHAGFDFAVIDTEHSLLNPETLEHMVRAAHAASLSVLVRVEGVSPAAIGRVLDAGASGILVPRVRGVGETRTVVRAALYAPQGERGLNAGRSASFGATSLTKYVERANDETVVGVMIEDQEGLANVDEVLAVSGLDFVMEGAADLSQSLGVSWQTRHPVVVQAVTSLQATAATRHVPFCAVPRVLEDFAKWWDLGVRLFVLGDERGVALRALQAHVQRFRAAIPSTEICR
ncbi:HpcH/HpaI aldolase family protein [Nitrospira sp. Nam74]